MRLERNVKADLRFLEAVLFLRRLIPGLNSNTSGLSKRSQGPGSTGECFILNTRTTQGTRAKSRI